MLGLDQNNNDRESQHFPFKYLQRNCHLKQGYVYQKSYDSYRGGCRYKC